MHTLEHRKWWYARLAALLLCVAPGCARRFDLTPTELERVEEAGGEVPPALREGEVRRPGPGLELLRVYLSRRLRSYYAQEAVAERFEVATRRIKERAVHRPRVRRIPRDAPGKVIAEDTQGGMRRLWVTFHEGCDAPRCAYGFVETELGRYSLVVVPRLESYQEPRNYRRARLRRNLLKPVRQRSMNEANEVLAATRRSGKALTIDLQIRKDRRRPTWRDGETLRGVNF